MMRAEQLVRDPLKESQRKRKSDFEDKAFHPPKAAFLYAYTLPDPLPGFEAVLTTPNLFWPNDDDDGECDDDNNS